MAEPFKFDFRLEDVPECPDFNEDDREILKMIAEPGGSLWKIMRRMVDYRRGLEQSLVTAEFTDPESQVRIRRVQAAIQATMFLESIVENALQGSPPSVLMESK